MAGGRTGDGRMVVASCPEVGGVVKMNHYTEQDIVDLVAGMEFGERFDALMLHFKECDDCKGRLLLASRAAMEGTTLEVAAKRTVQGIPLGINKG